MFGIKARRLLTLSLLLILTAPFLFAAQQAGNSGNGPTTLSLPEHGVTMQVPPGWSHRKTGNVNELFNLPPGRAAKLTDADRDEAPRIDVASQHQHSHQAAVKRLQQVALEQNSPVTYLTIGGWPALQRVTTVKKPSEGETAEDEDPEMLYVVTTAVAVANDIFRIDASIPVKVPLAKVLADQAKSIGASLKFSKAGNASNSDKEVQSLQSAPAVAPASSPKANTGSGISVEPPSGLQQQLVGADTGLAFNLSLGAEPEIAVSSDGKNVVIAAGFSFRSSQDGGVTFPSSGGFSNSTGGDSSLGVGRTGRFYEATIGSSTCTPKCNNDSQMMSVSTDGGKTFNPIATDSQGTYFQCSGNCAFGGVPDQEHIAVDRYNFGPSGSDQIYSVWRRPWGYMITCSSDSGANWTAASYRTGGTVDFPRITVGQDGSVYVVVQNGNNVELDKYNSCSSGFANVYTGHFVASANAVTCPVTGLDRCNDGNDLRSPTVAVDDMDANHVYVSFATNTAAGNENVMLFDSTDGGNNFPGGADRSAQLNNSIPGRRYMPWVCSVGGQAYVSWYDRRNAFSPGGVDLTDYFTGVAGRDSNGDLAFLNEFQVNAPNTSDPNCAPGWPCGARSANDSLACTGTQLAGRCRHNPNDNTDSNQACDLNGGTCSDPTETCQTSGGCPKYGDYNGNACAAGRIYNIWATSTSQPNANPAVGIDLFYSSKLVCCEPQIQAPKSLSLNACTGANDTVELNVCNTGKEDLRIDAITSSDTHFSVPAPSSSYPVVISHDACFPFSVKYTPTAAGASNTGNLTISSNDTVNPSTVVQVSGSSGAPKLAASIVNSGDFGNVCGGSQSNLAINIVNQGTCDLVVSGIASNDPNFLPPTTVNFPLTLSHDASTQLPITYKPTGTCSDTTSNTGTFTISSNAVPATTQVSVSGKQPCPHLNFNPTGLTGIDAFPPTVSDPLNNLGCYSDKTLTLSNSGACSLSISDISAASASNAFTVVNPTSFPLTIAPGGGTQKITVRFKPISLAGQLNNAPDDQTGTLSITSNDPNAAGTAPLCGEPVVKSGVRVLVTNNANVPWPSIDALSIDSFGLQPGISQTLRPSVLLNGSACGNAIQFHVDNETLVPVGTTGSNPKASYRINAKLGSSQTSQSITLDKCEMKQMILQIQPKK